MKTPIIFFSLIFSSLMIFAADKLATPAAPPVTQSSVTQIKEACKAEGKAGKDLVNCISEKLKKPEK